MALDARRRQKKAEKRNAKQKAKRQELARRNPDDVAIRLQRTTAAPILHCCTTQDLWNQGIAQVLVSRDLSNGQVAFAAFMIDRYCLGVKNAFCDISPRSEYFEKVYEQVADRGELVPLEPAAARKLVEGAVEYAKSLGFSPHGDYSRAKWIFGDIDPAASDQAFEFGKDGKPFFISGPYDSPGRCASIVGILSERCGTGGFHYLVQVAGSTLIPGATEQMGWEDLDDDLEDDDSDDVIEGSVAQESPLPSQGLSGALRRMIFGGE